MQEAALLVKVVVACCEACGAAAAAAAAAHRYKPRLRTSAGILGMLSATGSLRREVAGPVGPLGLQSQRANKQAPEQMLRFGRSDERIDWMEEGGRGWTYHSILVQTACRSLRESPRPPRPVFDR